MGILTFKNNSDISKRQINTGNTVLNDKGLMVSWKDMTTLNYWPAQYPQCNSLEGARDPSGWPLDLKKEDAVDLFIGGVGRDITFKYEKEVSESHQQHLFMQLLTYGNKIIGSDRGSAWWRELPDVPLRGPRGHVRQPRPAAGQPVLLPQGPVLPRRHPRHLHRRARIAHTRLMVPYYPRTYEKIALKCK